jgi:two-component system, response regulator
MVDVLLIDDNPLDVEITLRAFKAENTSARVHVAHDADEALSFMFGTDPSSADLYCEKVMRSLRLVLLDVRLAPVGGVEILKQIKSHHICKRVPVIMLSMSADAKDISDCYDAGANSYLVKPVDYDEFREVSRLIGPYWLQLNQPPGF